MALVGHALQDGPGQVALVTVQGVAHVGHGQLVPVIAHIGFGDLFANPVQLQALGQGKEQPRGVLDRRTQGEAHLDDVEGRGEDADLGQFAGQGIGEALLEELAMAARVGAPRLAAERLGNDLAQAAAVAVVAFDHRVDAQVGRVVAQHPADGPLQQPGDQAEGLVAIDLVDPAVELLELAPQGLDVEHGLADLVGAGDVDDVGAGLLAHAEAEAGADLVDDLVAQSGGDDLLFQRVAEDFLAEGCAHGLGEVIEQHVFGKGFLGDLRGQQGVLVEQLAVGQQDTDFGSGQPLVAGDALGDLLVAGQVLELATEHPVLLQVTDEATVLVHQFGRAHQHDIDDLGLGVVVAQAELGHLVGHVLEQTIAFVEAHFLAQHHAREGDLDVDLVIGAVDAGGVVDGVGVDQAAVHRVLDAAELGEAEVAAFADHLDAQLATVDAQGVVGLVHDIGVAFLLALHIGADAAVPQQVHRGLEQQLNQFVGGDGIAAAGGQRLHLRAHGDLLLPATEDAAALADELVVVVVPAGAREAEQALAFGIAGFAVRARVDEDVLMVEGGHQPDLARQQHAVAEHVAGHVADADDAEGFALDVPAQHAEVALDRLPGPARGDAHFLVVVAGGAAGGEGILQPVIQLHRDGIGGVGKARGTLVRGNHQVRVRIVVDPGAHRVDDLAVDDVVGQFQQGADVELVTVPDLVEAGVPVQPGDALGDEAALGAGGHDDRVLDHLGLHQAQHLGAVILATIRPANAAAGHLAAAQVDALETGAVDEDLVQRPRFGQSVDETRFELETQVFQLAGRLLEVIATHGGLDQVEHLPEDAVLVEGFDFVERFQVTVALGGKLVRALVRIEMQVEHAHQA